MKQTKMKPIYVVDIPEVLDSGVLYISKEHQIAMHKCCCGCGEEVVTPLSPVEWKLVESRDGVSLFPSIGNWNYKCQSHYFIREDSVIWASAMSAKQIARVQMKDKKDMQQYIDQRNANRLFGSISRYISKTLEWFKKLFRL